MKKGIKIAVSALVVVALAFALFGCGAAKNAAMDTVEENNITDSDYGYSYQDYADYDSPEGAEAAYESNSKSSETKPAEETKTEIPETTRKLVRDARLDVETKEFDSFIASVEKKAAGLGGYIEKSEIDGNGYYSSYFRSATITVRVPEDKFDDFIGVISETANIRSKSVSVRDITSDYIDTESRIRALEAEQTALLDILKKAKNVTETLEIYNRLSEVNAQLDRYKSTLKSYDNMVSYSKVVLDISEVEKITEKEQEGFFAEIRRRLSDNLYSISQGFRSFGIWLISSLPYIVIIAAVGAAVVLVIKKAVKKRRAKKAAKKQSSEAEQ